MPRTRSQVNAKTAKRNITKRKGKPIAVKPIAVKPKSVKRNVAKRVVTKPKKQHSCKYKKALEQFKKILNDDQEYESDNESLDESLNDDEEYDQLSLVDSEEESESEEEEDDQDHESNGARTDVDESEDESDAESVWLTEPEDDYIRIQDTIRKRLKMNFDAQQCRRVGEIASYLYFQKYGKFPVKHEVGVGKNMSSINSYRKCDEDIIVTAAQAFRQK